MKRIIVFVDHEVGWRLLSKILSMQRNSVFDLVAVVTTQENGNSWWPGVSELCNKGSIPLFIYSEKLSEILCYKDIDWYFLLSWKHIMPSHLLRRPRHGAINLHYSLLPKYRGVYPVNWAIIDGQDKTGVTYHLVTEKIDGGNILFQKEVQIRISDTARTLQLRMDDIAVDMFNDVLEWATISENRNSNLLDRKNNIVGTYKSRLDFFESNEIDLNREYRAIDLLNLLRGKTFRPETRSLYFIDPNSRKKIYVDINLTEDE